MKPEQIACTALLGWKGYMLGVSLRVLHEPWDMTSAHRAFVFFRLSDCDANKGIVREMRGDFAINIPRCWGTSITSAIWRVSSGGLHGLWPLTFRLIDHLMGFACETSQISLPQLPEHKIVGLI